MARIASVPFIEVINAVAQLRQNGVAKPSVYRLRKVLDERPSYGYLNACLVRLADLEAAGHALETLADIEAPASDTQADSLASLAVRLAELAEPIARDLVSLADERARRAEAEFRPLLRTLEDALREKISEAEGLVRALSDAEDRGAALQNRLTQAEQVNAGLSTELAALKAANEQLDTRLTETGQNAQRDRDRLEQERSLHVTNLQRIERAHERALTEQKKEYQHAREALELAQAAQVVAAADMAKLNEQLRDARLQASMATVDCDALRRELHKLMEAQSELQIRLNETDAKRIHAEQYGEMVTAQLALAEQSASHFTALGNQLDALASQLAQSNNPEVKEPPAPLS